MNPNFYLESSVNVKNNDNSNVYAVNSVNANFYTQSRSNPNFYVENNADDHCMPNSSPSSLTKTSMYKNIGHSTSMTKALNGITHSMKDKSTSSKPEQVSRRNLFKIKPIKYNCASPPLMTPVQVLVKAKNAQSNNIYQDMGDKLQSILMTEASVITQSGRDNSTSSPLMKPAQQSHCNLVTAKNAKSNSIHSINMVYKHQSATISEALNGITHPVRHSSTSPQLEPEQVSHRNLVETESTKFNSSSSRLTKLVHQLQNSLVKAKHTKSNSIHSMHHNMGQKRQSTSMANTLNLITQSERDNSTSSPLMKPAQQSHRNLVTAKNAKSNSIHSIHHNTGYKLQSATISETLNGITHSVRHNSTSSPLEPEQVSHRNLVKIESTKSNSSSSALTKPVHQLQSNSFKAKHTKSNSIHSMHHTMVAHKLQSSSMAEALNGITHSVRHNSTSSPLMKVVSHRNLVKAKNERQEEVHQPIDHDLHEFVECRPASCSSEGGHSSNSLNGSLNNKSYELKRLENNVASRKSRINRKIREDELLRRVSEAKEQNYQIHAELDKKYEELSELMYLIAVIDGKVGPGDGDLPDCLDLKNWTDTEK